jgi:16S rRNA (cytosine1402-N4)-methyltransferase
LDSESRHVPVLVSEVVELLGGKSVVIDATVGAGGHAEALLESGVGAVVGLDRDPSALALATERLRRFGARFRAVPSRFSQLAETVRSTGLERAGGVLFDLGLSSMQVDDAERGFSYRQDGPLDMRMGPEGRTAADVVNTYPEEDLSRVIFEHGQERYARRIAAALVRARQREPIESTRQLGAIVAGAVPRKRGGAHPARRTFQAIRIEVNEELEELAASLPQAASVLEPGGRLAVISYHSLEDRIVKRFLVGASSRDIRASTRDIGASSGDTGAAGLTILTRKPVRPAAGEAAANPRARSAKLRAAERPAEAA